MSCIEGLASDGAGSYIPRRWPRSMSGNDGTTVRPYVDVALE